MTENETHETQTPNQPSLRLRPYKSCDAEKIVSWCKDERAFRLWCSDRFPRFPITAADLNKKYFNENGDCVEADDFYPFTAFDESGIVGHLILRFADVSLRTIRFGFVIVDDTKRGRGYGSQLLRLALRLAFDILKAQRVTLGVFDTNPAALRCYKSVGFKEVPQKREEQATLAFGGETWRVTELKLERSAYEGAINADSAENANSL